MHSNHQRFQNSQSNIRFSLKLSSSKNDGSKSLLTKRENMERRTSCFNTLPQIPDVGRSINLPPVEPKSPTTKSCSAVDLLQLANAYSNTNVSHSRRSLSKFSAESITRMTISAAQKQVLLGESVNSDPDVFRKQKRDAAGRQSNSKDVNSTFVDEKTTSFAKSWPLAPLERHSTVARLPQITPNEKDNPHTLRGGLNQFNQSRFFRGKQIISPRKRDEHGLEMNSDVLAIRNNDFSNDSIKQSDGSSGSNKITIEAVTSLQNTRSCNKTTCDSCKQKQNRFEPELGSSKDSELTHVTEESVKVHPDDEKPKCTSEDAEESGELDRKCIVSFVTFSFQAVDHFNTVSPTHHHTVSGKNFLQAIQLNDFLLSLRSNLSHNAKKSSESILQSSVRHLQVFQAMRGIKRQWKMKSLS